jgi:REP element-mobilizing transposase RayT
LVFHVITCSKKGTAPFLNNPFTEEVYRNLLAYFIEKTHLYAACIMPDHIHLLIRPRRTNIIEIISNWKRYISNLSRNYNLKTPIWQASFFDHVLRNNEQLADVARYIIENPIRKRLVSDAASYPFSYVADIRIMKVV